MPTDTERLDFIELKHAELSCLGPDDIDLSRFEDIYKVDLGYLLTDGKWQALTYTGTGLRAAIDTAMKDYGDLRAKKEAE